MFQRVDNQVTLDTGYRIADKFGTGHNHVFVSIDNGVLRIKDNRIFADFVSGTQQHGAMQRIFQFADIARPEVIQQLLFGAGGKRLQIDFVQFGIFLANAWPAR